MKKVLVVDDQPTVVRLIDATLKKIGVEYVLDYCSDGAQGRLKALQRPYDLIILDLAMPFMGGLEALAEIKRDPKTADVIVVVITGIKEPAQHREAERLGAAAVVTKPFEIEEFARILRLALERQIKPLRGKDEPEITWRD